MVVVYVAVFQFAGCVAMPWLVVSGRDLQNVFSDLNSVNTDRMGGRGGGLLWIHSIGGDWFPFSHRTLTVEKTNPPPTHTSD